MLYPLKFHPRLKERIWGGRKLEEVMGKRLPEGVKIGESWEVSGVEGDVSVVSNGYLEGNDLQELIEVYMGELVGEEVFLKYGLEFPVLVKLIDAQDVLSVQVHPDDDLARTRHGAYGKTEMWYVVDCEPGAALYVGFNRAVSREEYLRAVADGRLESLLKRVEVSPGQAWFIPAGTIHAIGRGVVIAEIQQTSDITYRVDDWGRVDESGNPREMHTELAVDAIDFGTPGDYDITRLPVANRAVTLKECPWFTTNIIALDGTMERDYSDLDSFVIYLCVEGSLELAFDVDNIETLSKGESVLVPAETDLMRLSGHATVLEVYMGAGAR